MRNKFFKIAQAALGFALIFTGSSCDAANNPSALVGHWLGGGTDKKPKDIELFKDGTGVCDGVDVFWKVENKRLVVLSPSLSFASDYEVSGFKLTLTGNAKKVKYVNINNKKYPQKGTFSDSRDGRKYGTIEIGPLIWFSENLDYEAEGSKCYGNEPTNCQKYGRLYDWNTALKVCPKGWHLPSNDEWQELVDFVGGGEVAGTKLKAKDFGGTDDYGFSALPGGSGYSSGDFYDVGYDGDWWSSTEGSAANAYGRLMGHDDADVDKDYYDKTSLYSVRCVQD
jgi:uncharacterized protein (TIGR02145 family)